MDKIEIYGGHQLKGTVSIAGAKNAALPLMCTSLLTDQCIILKNVPSSLSDIVSMAKLLKQTGVEIQLSKKEPERMFAGETGCQLCCRLRFSQQNACIYFGFWPTFSTRWPRKNFPPRWMCYWSTTH